MENCMICSWTFRILCRKLHFECFHKYPDLCSELLSLVLRTENLDICQEISYKVFISSLSLSLSHTHTHTQNFLCARHWFRRLGYISDYMLSLHFHSTKLYIKKLQDDCMSSHFLNFKLIFYGKYVVTSSSALRMV